MKLQLSCNFIDHSISIVKTLHPDPDIDLYHCHWPQIMNGKGEEGEGHSHLGPSPLTLEPESLWGGKTLSDIYETAALVLFPEATAPP